MVRILPENGRRRLPGSQVGSAARGQRRRQRSKLGGNARAAVHPTASTSSGSSDRINHTTFTHAPNRSRLPRAERIDSEIALLHQMIDTVTGFSENRLPYARRSGHSPYGKTSMQISNTAGQQTIDYYFADDWDMNKVARALMEVPEWLKTCQRALTKAIKFSSKVMVDDFAITPDLLYLLHAYFRCPLGGEDYEDDCRRVVQQIIPKLLQTNHGLNLNRVEIADLSQLPGIAKSQWQCMGLWSQMMGQEQKQMAGVVFESFFESGVRAVSETFFPRDFFSPKEGRITVNYELLWQIEARAKNPLYSVKTFMHEAMHKFTHAEDKHYFPPDSIFASFTKNIDLMLLIPDRSKTYEQIAKAAWANTEKFPAIQASMTQINKISPDDLLINADGLASYALDVADLCTRLKK